MPRRLLPVAPAFLAGHEGETAMKTTHGFYSPPLPPNMTSPGLGAI